MTLMSWIVFGFKSMSERVMPLPLSWKVPSVSPRASISKVLLSSMDIFHFDFFTFNLFDTGQSFGNNREIPDTQEIEFEKSYRHFSSGIWIQGVHVILRNNFLFPFSI